MAKNDNPKVQSGTMPREMGEDTFSPLVDLYETKDGTTVLAAELPGAKSDSIDIRVEKGVLSIYADARAEGPGPHYNTTYAGFVRGQYFRAFAVSDEIDRDRIEASFKEGVLTLTLPRATAATTRKIEIKSE
ncbi:MAG: Hsp20/alpha crystallin family protein [Planctomycetaceae bacterium]|nr:Hsp20/alpha crystallin family protein [Planctomycetaceae bacterium]